MRRVGEVTVATNAEAGLEFLRSTTVHILVLSSSLAQREGEQILQALREREPFAQVMVLCERHTTEVPTSLLAQGVGDVLVKPFDVAGLPPRLEKLLEVMEEQRRRARLQNERDTQMRHGDRMALLGTLVATVAHEVANPLSVIVTNAALVSEMLQEGGPVEPRDRKFLQAAMHDTLASSNVIKDYLARILQFSRREKQYAWNGDLADTLKTALLFVRSRLRDKNVTVHVDDASPVPSVPHHATAFAQAVVNALSNAIEAVDTQGNVWLRVEESKDTVTVVVEDDGPGLQDGQGLFHPFFTTKEAGTGLGTAVMRQVMLEHGGTVEWKNLEGRGVGVRLSLPRRPPTTRFVSR
jgi:signal transduction histidine kinase